MKTLVAALITALLVFTLATGWTEFVQPRLDVMTMAASSKATAKSSDKDSLRRAAEIADDGSDEDESPNESAVRVAPKSSRSSRQRREEAAIAEKTKVRLAAQLAEVKQQESKLVAREETLRMLYDDIRSELVAVEEIRRRSASELALAERQVTEAAQNKTRVASVLTGGDTPTNSTTKALRPAEAYIARMVEDLANQGSPKTAAELLRNLKDRDAAKLLASISVRNRRLADQLSDQIQAAKRDNPIRR